MKELPLHISSGGLVYKKENGQVFIALLSWFRKWGELWMLPKETVEEKDAQGKNFEDREVLKKAAHRALLEEMNIKGEIEDYLGELQEKITIDKVRRERHIHYFLFTYKEGELQKSWEHDTAKWFSKDEVLNLRLKKGEEEIVEKSLKYLKVK